VTEAVRDRLEPDLLELLGRHVAQDREMPTVGCRYWPMVRMSTRASRRSEKTSRNSSLVSPVPSMRPDLVSGAPISRAFLSSVRECR
jgi:hypothetical protein